MQGQKVKLPISPTARAENVITKVQTSLTAVANNARKLIQGRKRKLKKNTRRSNRKGTRRNKTRSNRKRN